MSEHPILFSGEMVLAILDGRKSETRRVMKPQPNGAARFSGCNQPEPYVLDDTDLPVYYPSAHPCPFGVPVDRLYVKEGLRKINLAGMEAFWAFYDASLTEASGRVPLSGQASDGCGAAVEWKWKKDFLAARFMPKWVARLWLEVVEVRAERVQDITEEGAKAEGVENILQFSVIWDKINRVRGFGWSADPWIWVISFRRMRNEIRTPESAGNCGSVSPVPV